MTSKRNADLCGDIARRIPGSPSTRQALLPPNPKELDSTAFIFFLIGSITGRRFRAGSGSVQPVLAGTSPSRTAREQTTASTAPAAASEWPVAPFTDDRSG